MQPQAQNTREEAVKQFGFQEQQRAGTAEFAARPRKIINREGPKGRQSFYRDPIREMIRVAPQNLMYDRRIVRGNTFAALVIPVNMQPDNRPQTTIGMKAPRRLQQNSQRVMSASGSQHLKHTQGSRMMSSQRSGSRAGQETHMQSTHLDNLSDYDNMVQESRIEPDYFIDRPPSAIFYQDSPGHDKTTMLNDRTEQELFDFDSEIEPVLQVLVGKALELSRIEVIEEFEAQQLKKHKKLYKTLRESELLETQRLERERVCCVNEIEHRNMQMSIVQVGLVEIEKKQIARHASKKVLRFLKRNTLSDLVQMNQLRSRLETDLGSKIVNELKDNAINSFANELATAELFSIMTSTACSRVAKTHQESILTQLKRKEDAVVAAKFAEIKKRNETVERRKMRADLREEARIEKLQSKILKQAVHWSMKVELKADTQILDVNEPPKSNETVKRGHLSTLGGLIGEVIIAFSCLQDYIATMTAAFQKFQFTSDHFETFFGLILDKEFGKIILTLIKAEEEEEEDAATLLQRALKPENHASMGLRFFIQNMSQMQLNQKVTKEVLKAIINIATYVEPKPEQDDGAGSPGKKSNQKYQALKNNVFLQYTSQQSAKEDHEDLQAFVKVKNFKEPPFGSLEHDGKLPQEPKTPFLSMTKGTSQSSRISSGNDRTEGRKDDEFEPVQLETISKTIICLPTQVEECKILVQHTEAVYLLRKQIAECAQRMLYNELRDLQINTFLQMCQSRQNYINSNFEQMLVNSMGFNQGCNYVGTNLTIIYKTFLEK